MSRTAYVCRTCHEPMFDHDDPDYRPGDYIRDGQGYVIQHAWCPAPETGSEDWFWDQHCFVWDTGCGKDDCDEACHDFGGHLCYRDMARIDGFQDPDLDDQEYRAWLLSTFGPDLPASLPLPALPASASHIEKLFWNAYRQAPPRELNGLVFQHPVANYRLDFALPDRKIGIELDGFRNHSSAADIENDHVRQRWLEGYCWFILRFSGREVVRDAGYCVYQAAWFAVNYRRGHLE